MKKVAIVNLDDEKAEDFLKYGADIKYGTTMTEKKSDEAGIVVDVSGEPRFEDAQVVFDIRVDDLADTVTAPVTSSFEIENLLLAIAVAHSQGIQWTKIKQATSMIKRVPGRVQYLNLGQPYKIIVDYAHEPKSLEAILGLARREAKGRVLILTGSTGGGRDKGKRPQMGKVAFEHSDYMVVTNEDPYDEDPQTIVDDVASGAIEAGATEGERLMKILDRKEAIRHILEQAKVGDVVVLAGKGSETVMAIAHNKKMPWSDAKAVEEILLEQKGV